MDKKIHQKISICFIEKNTDEIFSSLNEYENSIKKFPHNRFELNNYYTFYINVLLALLDLKSIDREIYRDIIYKILEVVSTKLQINKYSLYIVDKVLKMLLNNKYLLEYNKILDFKEELFPCFNGLSEVEAKIFSLKKDETPELSNITLEKIKEYLSSKHKNNSYLYALRFLSSLNNVSMFDKDFFLEVIKIRKKYIYELYEDSSISLANPLFYLDELKDVCKDFYVYLAPDDSVLLDFAYELVLLANDYLIFDREVDSSECIDMAKTIYKIKNVKVKPLYKKVLGFLQYKIADYNFTKQTLLDSISDYKKTESNDYLSVFDIYIHLINAEFTLNENDTIIINTYVKAAMIYFRKIEITEKNKDIIYHSIITFIKINKLEEAKTVITKYRIFEKGKKNYEHVFLPYIEKNHKPDGLWFLISRI